MNADFCWMHFIDFLISLNLLNNQATANALVISIQFTTLAKDIHPFAIVCRLLHRRMEEHLSTDINSSVTELWLSKIFLWRLKVSERLDPKGLG